MMASTSTDSLPIVFERFTDRARRVLVLAQEEARLLRHAYIGTEHLLLGMIHEHRGIAAQVLAELGITTERARHQLEQIVGIHDGEPPTGSPPFTSRAKKVLELSLREALQLGHSYIGPEHMLLGLVREGEGTGARIIQDLGVELKDVRVAVLREIMGDQSWSEEDSEDTWFAVSSTPRCKGCSASLESVLRYRTATVPSTSPDLPSLSVDIVYCNQCGTVISVVKTESLP